MAEDNNNEVLTNSSEPITFSQRIKNYFAPEGIQLEMMRYRPNKGAYYFGLIAAVSLALGFCVFYSSTEITQTNGFQLLWSTNAGPWLGVDVVLNIVLLLFMLSISMEIKNYAIKAGYVSIGIGIFQIVRIFLLPLSLLRCGTMASGIFIFITVTFVISGVLSILSGFLSIYRGTALRKYLMTVKPIENEKVGK